MGGDRYHGWFVWDVRKEQDNLRKHGVDFETATKAFLDAHRKVYTDAQHGHREERLFCLGKVGGKILTVRFTHRGGLIRIIGAGFWRKGRRYYEATDG